ncbi:MAG: type III pantothenate kinase [Thermodesulfovibrionia bacterium]
MLLLIDIGNTSTKIGLYENGFKRVLNFKTSDDTISFNGLTRNHIIEGAVICSVVPSMTSILINLIKREYKINPLIVNHKIKSGLRYKIRRPENIGPDRIAIAVGARMLYKGDLIVVSFGTATTLSLINRDNEYLGGAIMPGLQISADALAERTALLPRVKLRRHERIIGRDTEEAILTGIITGHAGGVERIIKEMKRESGLNPRVIATGGLADIVVPYIRGIKDVNPLLCLEGLRFLYGLNVK